MGKNFIKIAAAQTLPHSQNTEANLRDHCRLAELAAQHSAQLIIFPEMSLTGYQRELAGNMAFSENDGRLDPLKKIAALHNIIIVAGAPIKTDAHLYIGAFIISPGNSLSIYTKQFLHSGEEKFFEPCFDHNPQ